MMVANNHFLCDAMGDSKPLKLVAAEEKQKGMETILEECGINIKGLLKEDIIKLLEKMQDFKFQ